jgi:hypothetical protein
MWRVVGASVAGRSHEKAGRGCEDAFSYCVTPELTCLVVADGAGSRARAQQGSALAVRSVMQRAICGTGGSLTEWMRDTFEEVRRTLTAAAAEVDGATPDDFATTLGVVVVAGQDVCVGQVGDSLAVVGVRGRYRTVDPPPRFEYANQTVFVTSPDLGKNLRVTAMAGSEVEEVFLSTDGLRMKILDDLATHEPYEPFFLFVADYVRTGKASNQWVTTVLSQVDDQTGDDKSLIVAIAPTTESNTAEPDRETAESDRETAEPEGETADSGGESTVPPVSTNRIDPVSTPPTRRKRRRVRDYFRKALASRAATE